MREYAAALDGVKAQMGSIGAGRTIPGTFNALCVSYFRSPEFTGLKASTQGVRRNIIERFRNEHGDKPLKGLGRDHIKKIIGDKAATPEAANNLLKVLRVLLAHAVDSGMLEHNPASRVKKYKSRGEGFHTWTEAEVEQFESRHAFGTKPRLAIELLLGTGQRRSDVIRMGWQYVRGDEIAVRQQKTDAALTVPMTETLMQALATLPRTNMTFLLTEFGKPFTSAGFGNWFRDRCDEAGLPQCSAHGLRKLAATRLANAGCSTEHIKAITGHKSASEVARYTRAADQQRLARQAVRMLRANREQSLSNHENRLDKTDAK